MAEKLFDTEERQERIILVGVETAEGDDTKQSLEELEELGQTAGAVTVGMVIQKRERMHPGTYIGKGKIEEVAALVSQCNADTVVCDDELSPAQLRNLSDALDVKVIDRTVMILDIFAKHATTNEGKLQVELAQLRYRSSHLIGERTELSRLGGGIGTRGPGEQKLEQDRRLIRNRISQLKKELEQVTRTRTLTRKKRQENPIPVIAIVGYTNAGKSTLLNYLTGAGVLSQDKLFATLDPTTRKLTTQEGEEFLFTDTVGFIRKLPHHLIQAFRSTLEEAKYADMILHVVDCANPGEVSDCVFPSVVRRGNVVIGISTSGGVPALTRYLREKIEALIPEWYGELEIELRQKRRELKMSGLGQSDRKKYLRQWIAKEEKIREEGKGQYENRNEEEPSGYGADGNGGGGH